MSVLLIGIGVGDASAWGKSYVLGPKFVAPKEAKSDLGHQAELDRLKNAIAEVVSGMRQTEENADATVRDILSALGDMLEDPALLEEATTHLLEGWNAETSVVRAMHSFTELLAGDDLFGERVADLEDLALKVVANLSGVDSEIALPKSGPVIVVAEDLSPAETAKFTDAVVAVITEKGGPTSHTAIICRQRNIPALVAAKGALTVIPNGASLVVDASSGEAYLSDEPLGNLAETKRKTIGEPIIEVKGNVGSVDDTKLLFETRASGIGLMRTELLFLNRTSAPTLEEQTNLYAEVLSNAPKGEVIFRTLDAGSDKPLTFLGLAEEENPSLGVRGFRINEVDESVLATQLQALALAEQKTARPVSVMAPMIATVEEAKAFAKLARGFGLGTVGVMVETPSICVQITELAGVVDFVSIGTNDLSQYLFAADRQNSAVAALLNPWQPALLKTIAKVCEDANSVGIKVGVCGEAGADPLLGVVLAGLGVKSVSMASPAVAKAIEYLSSVTDELARDIAIAALSGSTPREAKDKARAALG
ncbi:MAG: putative PEP-binding protein [Rhodoluna sp.]